MLRILKWLFVLSILMVLGGAAAIWYAADSEPTVARYAPLTEKERVWARSVLKGSFLDGLRDGEMRELKLSERELSLLVAVAAERLQIDARLTAELEQGGATLNASLRLPWGGRNWLNLTTRLGETAGLPSVGDVDVGGMPVPALLVRAFAERLLGSLGEADLLHYVAFEKGRTRLVYSYRDDALDRFGSGLVDPAERERVLYYQNLIADFSTAYNRGDPVPLAKLLSDLFGAAHFRGGERMSENRAVILAVAAYVNGRTLKPLDDGAPPVREPRPLRVQLRRRGDLTKHYMASAAIAAEGGTLMSDVVGKVKELSDSDGGSGFSFADMAANRAGIRLAELATGTAEGARHVQQLARAGFGEDDIMPRIDGLPEGLQQALFEQQFGEVDSAAYRRVVTHIDERIDSRVMFRSFAEKTKP